MKQLVPFTFNVSLRGVPVSKQPNMQETEDEPPVIRASLVLRQFGEDPDEISRILGLLPARSGRRGDRHRNVLGRETGRIVPKTYWALNSQAGSRDPLETQIASILEQVRDVRSAFDHLPPGTEVSLRCTVIPNGDLPLFQVGSQQMYELGAIGASLEIDIISVGAEPVEATT